MKLPTMPQGPSAINVSPVRHLKVWSGAATFVGFVLLAHISDRDVVALLVLQLLGGVLGDITNGVQDVVSVVSVVTVNWSCSSDQDRILSRAGAKGVHQAGRRGGGPGDSCREAHDESVDEYDGVRKLVMEQKVLYDDAKSWMPKAVNMRDGDVV